MSMPFHVYGVKLEDFYNSLGSKNQKLLEKTLTYLNELYSHCDKRELEIYSHCLRRMIFDGVIESKQPPWELGDSSKEAADKFFHHKALMLRIFEALFSQFSVFKVYSRISIRPFSKVFDDLKQYFGLDQEALKLWSYVIKGRSLRSEPISDGDKYGYLFLNEIARLLISFENYQTTIGLEHLKQQTQRDSDFQSDLEWVWSTLEEMVKQKQDALFLHSY